MTYMDLLQRSARTNAPRTAVATIVDSRTAANASASHERTSAQEWMDSREARSIDSLMRQRTSVCG